MYCEFYIDVFFAVNLLMNFWVLCLTNVLLKGTANPFGAFWGAVFGAGSICGFLLFAKEIHTAVFLIFYSISVLTMVRTGCGFKTLKKLLAASAAFFGVSFCLGGILLFAEPLLPDRELPFLLFTTAAYLILYTGIRLCKYLKGKSSLSCDVEIMLKDREIKIKGLYDTGNCLLDTRTGKPVCVMEYSSFAKLLDREQKEALDGFCAMKLQEDGEQMEKELQKLQPRFVLYTSVGCQRGLLPVVTAEGLRLSTEDGKKEIRGIPIGLCRTSLSPNRSFQIIINPGILESGEEYKNGSLCKKRGFVHRLYRNFAAKGK